MKVIKRDYKKIVDESIKIDKNFFVDLFVDNYTPQIMQADFGKMLEAVITDENYLNVLSQLIVAIKSKIPPFDVILDKIIARNNHYVEQFGYQKMSLQELEKAFNDEFVPALHRQGISASMMILYYFSKNIFNNEVVESLKKLYAEHSELIEQKTPLPKKPNEMNFTEIELMHFISEDYKDTNIINWSQLAEKFNCEYSENTQKFNNVARGILVFLDSKINLFLELQAVVDSYYQTLTQFAKKIESAKQKQELIAKQLFSLRDENIDLKNKYKRLKKQLIELEKIANTVKKESPQEKDKQILALSKQNSYLRSRIEALESKIQELEEAQEINKTIQENVVTEDLSVVEIAKQSPNSPTNCQLIAKLQYKFGVSDGA